MASKADKRLHPLMQGVFDLFLEDCSDESIGSSGRVYAAAIRADAQLETEGRGTADTRFVCRDCGKRMRHPGEDYRCDSCNGAGPMA